ncbi:glycosyltransferase [Bacillus sp. Marseille-Q3570]|uniref:glycosyltransferase n=1 Tax=Bacillus sp. Marseille-Q3570 TaxID=2963522 RepID=UPI0021B786F3|nr:glycosyltransferase [Bacillus sp. Marseille-Q3570]
MNKMFVKLVIVLLIATMVFSPQQTDAKSRQKDTFTQKEVALSSDMRRLWTDHITWTRSYMVSAIGGLEDQDAVLSRLLQNQKDIGNAIKPYYGDAASKKLAELLTEHIIIAGELIEAAKNNDQANVDKFTKQWYANADEIAQFLSDANPNWPKKTLKGLLDEHLALLTDQVVFRLQKRWDDEIKAYDDGETHILKLADALSEGIIKQFPDKFI